MRRKGNKLWLSANDTYNWAHKAGASWPCSFLSGKTLYAEFAGNGDLVDMAVNGGRGDQDCPADEFTAITDDFMDATDDTNIEYNPTFRDI